MILNETTASHPFHQEDRRAKSKQVLGKSGLATGDCITGMSIEAKCAWMRKRQELIRAQRSRNRRGTGHKPPLSQRPLRGRRV